MVLFVSGRVSMDDRLRNEPKETYINWYVKKLNIFDVKSMIVMHRPESCREKSNNALTIICVGYKHYRVYSVYLKEVTFLDSFHVIDI